MKDKTESELYKELDAVPTIASFLDSTETLLRERAVNALGRIGRGDQL